MAALRRQENPKLRLTRPIFVPLLLALPSALQAQATWTNRTNASTPTLGMNFASAFDEVRGRLVVFGGRVETSSSAAAVDAQYNCLCWCPTKNDADVTEPVLAVVHGDLVPETIRADLGFWLPSLRTVVDHDIRFHD